MTTPLKAKISSPMVVLALVLVAFFAGFAVRGTADRFRPADATFPACTTEDDERDCYWNARERGNGLGQSFIRYNGGTYYLP